MRNIFLLFKSLLIALVFLSPIAWADNSTGVPILTYHNFDPSVPGSMTMDTAKFEEQLKWIKDNGYTVIPLKQLVSYLEGKTASIPEKSVVITADDGRKTVYTHMLPLIRKYNMPVTLFIYPSAISNASYALTWDELKELQKTGLFDVQGHTYWHPNFKQEKKRLSPTDYEKFVQVQLVKSKKVLEDKLGINVTLLAWPFGIYDDYLEQQAAQAGYEMAFSIDGRSANKSENKMAQPRYMIVEGQSMQEFEAIIKGQSKGKQPQEN
jgi:peptidoglycan/xylan/chitin deacetylase (PgdA/CDA1 family)